MAFLRAKLPALDWLPLNFLSEKNCFVLYKSLAIYLGFLLLVDECNTEEFTDRSLKGGGVMGLRDRKCGASPGSQQCRERGGGVCPLDVRVVGQVTCLQGASVSSFVKWS